jgi:hypothetical protein
MGMKADTTSKDNNNTTNVAIYEHVADYFIQTLIKEDVNAFPEAKFLQEILVMKLPPVAQKLMYMTARDVTEMLKDGKSINLLRDIGGINTQKRMHFRSKDQYNAFIALFFNALEEHPELLASVDSEENFEKLMIECIHEFRQKLDDFAIAMAAKRSQLEQKHKAYIHHRNAEIPDLPNYSDFVAGNIDLLVE